MNNEQKRELHWIMRNEPWRDDNRIADDVECTLQTVKKYRKACAPKRHPRYSDAAKQRICYPHQVVILDYMIRVAANPPQLTERLHADFPNSASWCDFEGARTFGFLTRQEAERFKTLHGGRIK